jgi:hypothetical protein
MRSSASAIDGLEERVDLQAEDCIRADPTTMLDRLLADFEDVQTLLLELSVRLARNIPTGSQCDGSAQLRHRAHPGVCRRAGCPGLVE